VAAWNCVRVLCVAAVVVAAGCGGSADTSSRSTGSALADIPTGWSELPAPPEVRSRGAIAWTGQELLVWGGHVYTGFSDEADQGDGLIFEAADREWKWMAASPLAARIQPAAAWTGEELLVWGGTDGRRDRLFGDGAAYDPESDSWRRLPDAPIGARAPLSVWTGDELLVWGTAVRVHPRPRDGAAYDPQTNAWRPIAEAPIELTDATAVWTGREMIVFGAALHGGNFPETPTAIAAAYEPDTDTWRELTDSSLSPQASTTAWTGRELIAWDYLNGTAAFDPRENEWRALPDVPLDPAECGPESIALGAWVLGDYCGGLVRYDPAADRWAKLAGPDGGFWSFELVAADVAILLLARNHETDAERLFAYRP
jgi:hypothetical protein